MKALFLYLREVTAGQMPDIGLSQRGRLTEEFLNTLRDSLNLISNNTNDARRGRLFLHYRFSVQTL